MPLIITSEAALEVKKKELRKRISELLRTPQFVGMGSVAVSEALVASAFAWRDWNGGIEDTCHAAQCLHEIVDEIASEKIG